MATPPPILALRRRSGGTIQPLRYNGAAFANLGTAFGSVATTQRTATDRNYVVQFLGQLFCVGTAGIRQKDDPTAQAGTWTEVQAFTTTNANSIATGLHPVDLNGTPSLMMANHTSNQATFSVHTFDGTSWTDHGSGAAQGAPSITELKTEVVFQNQLHVGLKAGVDARAFVLDPSGTTSEPSNPFTGRAHDFDFCVFDDRLFAVYYAALYHIAEYTGTWDQVVANFDSSRAANPEDSQLCLFVEGGFMWALVWRDAGATGRGWRCYRFDTALAVTDVTDTVMPLPRKETSLTGGAGAGTNTTVPNFQRWVVVHDADTTPGSNQVWLYFAEDGVAGTTLTLYEWQAGGASEMVVDSAGGDTAHSLPTGYAVGERIWTAGELDIRITGVEAAVGGEKVKFRCSGAAGVGDKTVSFRFTSVHGAPNGAVATLIGSLVVESGAPTGSASRSGNTVINIDADPTVEYSITWDTVTDGAPGRAQLSPFISV